MTESLSAHAVPVLAAAIKAEVHRRRKRNSQMGDDGARNLAEQLVAKYPDLVYRILAERVGQVARGRRDLAEGAEDAEVLSSQRETNFFNLRRLKSTSASSASSAE